MSRSPTSLAGVHVDNRYDQGWHDLMALLNAGGSLSGHERNCCFLNTGGTRFADVSVVSGLDFLDDGRGVASVDWDGDGDLDLWLSARTGPTLRFARNDCRQISESESQYVAFHLVGESCNRDAIGARVTVSVGDHQFVRTLHAGVGFISQSSKRIPFGLGHGGLIKGVTVEWPGGQLEEFGSIGLNATYRLVQGTGKPVVTSASTSRETVLKKSGQPTHATSIANRLVLNDRVPMLPIVYEDAAGQSVVLQDSVGSPILVNLWATWCRPCLTELKAFQASEQKLRAAGLEVVALTVDGLDPDRGTEVTEAWTFVERISFPFRTGAADASLMDRLDVMLEVLIALRQPAGTLPSSFLLDRYGRLAVVYTGRVEVDQLLSDVRNVELGDLSARLQPFPFSGKWLRNPSGIDELLVDLAKKYQLRGWERDALRFGSLAASIRSGNEVLNRDSDEFADVFYRAGNESMEANRAELARRQYQVALQFNPDWAEAHSNLGNASVRLGRTEEAMRHFRNAVNFNPDLIESRLGLGLMCLESQNFDDATRHLEHVLKKSPEFPGIHHYLGISLIGSGNVREGAHHLRLAQRLDPFNEEIRRELSRLETTGFR